MKLLIAIEPDRPADITKGAAVWASRSGFNLRIFVYEPEKLSKYQKAIDSANYNDYLSLQYKMLVTDSLPLIYAQENDYDILALIPATLKNWEKNVNRNLSVIRFHAALSDARKQMSENVQVNEITFENGVRVIRVVKL